MAHYYCYLLDLQDRIKARETFTAADDGEAVQQAERYLASDKTVPGVELWLGERRIIAMHQSLLGVSMRPPA